MSEIATEHYFDAAKKNNRRQKRLARKSNRLQRRLETTDAKQGITSEHRKAMQEVELDKKKEELKQDQAVTEIAKALPAEPPTPAKSNTMTWLLVALALLIVLAVVAFYLL
jgi:hypothetical protein